MDRDIRTLDRVLKNMLVLISHNYLMRSFITVFVQVPSIKGQLLSDAPMQLKMNNNYSGYGTVEDVADNLVVIDILFSTTQETEITELVSYGWGNFLGKRNCLELFRL